MNIDPSITPPHSNRLRLWFAILFPWILCLGLMFSSGQSSKDGSTAPLLLCTAITWVACRGSAFRLLKSGGGIRSGVLAALALAEIMAAVILLFFWAVFNILPTKC